MDRLKSLFPDLVHYGSSDMLPLHMPGHKRCAGFMHGIAKYDITEIDGFDDLHHPHGVIKEAMVAAAAIYGSDATYFLVNGSSCGILAAIAATTKPHDKILLARNCHKSVLNAVYLRELDPVYVYPQKETCFSVDGSIDPDVLDGILAEEKDIRAVVVTSPTYEGVVSDLKTIAKKVHGYGIPLIVDAAHGAHFTFGADFPASALSCGADLVVESLHKTLPSLTQTALLHVKSDFVDLGEVQFQLQIFQSSSPSYLLIASITECLALMEKEGESLMAQYSESLRALRKSIYHLSQVTLLGEDEDFFGYDLSKIVFGIRGYGGVEIADLLRREFHIETEMASPVYVVAMTSVYDSKEALFRFEAALTHLCRDLPLRENELSGQMATLRGEKVLTPAAARQKPRQQRLLKDSVGAVAAENLYLYPPGTPLLVAGEKISVALVKMIISYEEQNFFVHGVEKGRIFVV